jgi:hypothetical protein
MGFNLASGTEEKPVIDVEAFSFMHKMERWKTPGSLMSLCC